MSFYFALPHVFYTGVIANVITKLTAL